MSESPTRTGHAQSGAAGCAADRGESAAASSTNALLRPWAAGPLATATGAAISLHHRLHVRVALPLLLALLVLPFVLKAASADYYIGLGSRMLIYALAASSLNLILGFGGMVSFGHAAFVGLGAYFAGILMQAGMASAWLAGPAAMLLGGAAASVIGLISLRTRGVYFIMITLAFAQMLYYLMISLQKFGGEDGLSLPGRASIGFGLDLADDLQFYLVVLVLGVLVLMLMARLLNARFGQALQAIRENPLRAQAIGIDVYRCQLLAFTLAGALAGLAGALLASHASFVSPSLMQWTQSGVLLLMVILGGVGHLYGGVVGAIAFLLIEELLSSYTIHWQFGLGAILLAVVLRTPNGLLSLWQRRS